MRHTFFITPARWAYGKSGCHGAFCLYRPADDFCCFLQVDVENPDLEKFPKFTEAPFLSCILSPGDTLFIPAKYWHYVRSLDLSFSVSFWWS